MNPSTQILFISHGGGPMPLLDDPNHQEMVVHLQELAGRLPRPSAILVISAHWEAPLPTITSGLTPGLIYDYSGFPAESYEIQYPCPGAPELAQQVFNALADAGIAAQSDADRGFDHGVFVPLKLMYPEADIPCVQLSLVNNLHPQTHLAIGSALRTLDYDNLLVIGSGFTFHNLQIFFAPHTPEIQTKNQAFEDWLEDTCTNSTLAEAERCHRLLHWAQAPHARFCHPREEHLLPLHVCYGMASEASDDHISATIMGKQTSMYCWSNRLSHPEILWYSSYT
ncbi:MAG: dioxygenase [Gammaproteobacteria bacterium]|uniref:DODA-type extradiol aromatic ring-opening family dioxygenase n=1 Tax=Pseudomaricurvus alcaniphilus TaxID=1166482 RepID=UPI00140E3FBD|nr:class III extradiol ring-cleavage dioxygenase [Pseudomaricurvus alcaniphilus]MBR9911066.1 dioxygenase [Gammaproteobacteria bacterium]NHN36430.1 dioxygenase [Pseudomaricurvus alcaniphilus]